MKKIMKIIFKIFNDFTYVTIPLIISCIIMPVLFYYGLGLIEYSSIPSISGGLIGFLFTCLTIFLSLPREGRAYKLFVNQRLDKYLLKSISVAILFFIVALILGLIKNNICAIISITFFVNGIMDTALVILILIRVLPKIFNDKTSQ